MLLRRTGLKIIVDSIQPGILGRPFTRSSSFQQTTSFTSYPRTTPRPLLASSPHPSLLTPRRIMTDTQTQYPNISTDETVYQTFLQSPIPGAEKGPDGEYMVDQEDWVQGLELDEVKGMTSRLAEQGGRRVKVLVLYGSLRERYASPNLVKDHHDPNPRFPKLISINSGSSSRSYSRLMAFEAARILHLIGCHVKVYDPTTLPIKDEAHSDHPKVKELRELSEWSDAQFWCSPEQHGNVTAVFKNQSELVGLGLGSWGSVRGEREREG